MVIDTCVPRQCVQEPVCCPQLVHLAAHQHLVPHECITSCAASRYFLLLPPPRPCCPSLRCAALLPPDAECELLRFLQARDWKVPQAAKMYRCGLCCVRVLYARLLGAAAEQLEGGTGTMCRVFQGVFATPLCQGWSGQGLNWILEGDQSCKATQ